MDLGASGGRVLLGRFDGERFVLGELHRFPNGPVGVTGHLYWDVLQLWSNIKTGLRRVGDAPLAGIGVDTWGVDFALLDAAGNLLGNPHHYRDARTDGVMEQVFERVGKKQLYERTGVQFMQINTLYQLYSLRLQNDPRLNCAETLLMMPDLFHYWLTGRKTGEYTIASTSQLLDARGRGWDTGLLEELSLPTHPFPDLMPPGTVIGPLLRGVADETGLSSEVPVIATGSHDTASAVAAIPDLDANSVFISSGTWSLMGVELAEPVLSERARALDVTNEGGVGGTIRLLKNVAGLWLLQESRRQWQREGREHTWDELLELATQAEPFRSFVDPGAETFLSPGDMPTAIRNVCRRTGQPEPESVGEVVRCCLESLALKYRSVLDGLEGLLERRLDKIYIVGGGSQNRLLNQFTADACRRIVVAGPVEATALGNLLVQAVATGHIENVIAGRRVVAA
ncbi:rhamnulokinase family protein [soil metagenome]